MSLGIAYIFVLFIFVFCLLSYAVRSLSLYELVKREHGSAEAWLAWVPFANRYLYGVLAGNKLMGLRNPGLTLVTIAFVSFCIQWSSIGPSPFLFLAFILNIVSYFLSSALLYKIYDKYTPKRAEEYLFTSMVLPFASAFILLKIAVQQIEGDKHLLGNKKVLNVEEQYHEYYTAEAREFIRNKNTVSHTQMNSLELPAKVNQIIFDFDMSETPEEIIPEEDVIVEEDINSAEYQLGILQKELTEAVKQLRK